MDFSLQELKKKKGWAKICQELVFLPHSWRELKFLTPCISSFPASDSQPALCVRGTNLFKASAENIIALDWKGLISHHRCHKEQPKRKEKAGELCAA